ncbi:DMT family transporter [Tropicibacter oceani]|uniref:DMT family transporter n=1 Tax=Tropicibacter oceani TaxID=3058420 RepID=A0ABY8QEU9_9RHOB|nr:DMT family transporter [Tropicibacter oceani]WGW03039.1 DMT family transporter [Tropicibacter oceani]
MDILRAIALMVLSMALLAGTDAFIKLSTQVASVGQTMLLLSAGGTLLFLALARLRGVAIFTADALHPKVMLRNGFEIIAAVGMVIGVANTSLPVFAAITQAGPLVVTMGAALFLGEEVGWRRWLAVLVGLIGMLIVIRPFGASFTGYELFGVLGITALSARDLVTRMSPPHIPALAISTWGFMATILPGLVLLAMADRPFSTDPATLWYILGAVFVTTGGYLAITTAMRMAPASVVSPFRYTRLIFATLLGIAVFDDWPDGWTLIGGALILGAGLYSFLRERRLARQAVSADR